MRGHSFGRHTAYEEVTGAELELAHTPVTAEEDDDWDFDDSDEMRKRFPKLFGRFGSGA